MYLIYINLIQKKYEVYLSRAINYIVRHTCRIKGYSVLTITEAERACRIAAEDALRSFVRAASDHTHDVHLLHDVFRQLTGVEYCKIRKEDCHGCVCQDSKTDHT